MTDEQTTQEAERFGDAHEPGLPSSISTRQAVMGSESTLDTRSASGTDVPERRSDVADSETSENALGLPPDLTARWQSVQVAFVDEPKRAVQDADALIEEVTDRLLQQFRQQRAELEHTWSSGEDASTEELRIALQKYRSFFERLLAA